MNAYTDNTKADIDWIESVLKDPIVKDNYVESKIGCYINTFFRFDNHVTVAFRDSFSSLGTETSIELHTRGDCRQFFRLAKIETKEDTDPVTGELLPTIPEWLTPGSSYVCELENPLGSFGVHVDKIVRNPLCIFTVHFHTNIVNCQIVNCQVDLDKFLAMTKTYRNLVLGHNE